MKRLRSWLVRRLVQPKLGEVRRMYQAEWILMSIDYSRTMYDPGRLILTYASQFEHLSNMALTDTPADVKARFQQDSTS